jgi:hypothetical protein
MGRNLNIAVSLLLVGFLLIGCGRLVNPVPTPTPTPILTPIPAPTPTPALTPTTPSDNDAFPDNDAFSDTDALSDPYSHAYSKSIRQRHSQLDSYAYSALPPSPPSPPPRQSHVEAAANLSGQR